MKFFLIPFLLLGVTAWSSAEVPKKRPKSAYAGLWTNSPFTSKPPPAAAAQMANPLDDYALSGVAPIPGGYRVTLLNKKNPEQRIVIPDDSNFRVIAVNYQTGSPLGTTVRVATGGKEGVVSFDEKLLTLKAPPAVPQVHQGGAPPPPGAPPQIAPPQNADGSPARQPRPRTVTPANSGAPGAAVPTPTAPPTPATQGSGGQRIQQRPNRR